jgi:hypothetical protein
MSEHDDSYLCSEPLWNEESIWNTTNPGLSKCFRKSVCLWVPVAALVAYTIFFTFVISKPWKKRKLLQVEEEDSEKKNAREIALPQLFFIKSALLASLGVLAVAEVLLLRLLYADVSDDNIDVVFAAVLAATVSVAWFLTWSEWKDQVISSAFQFIFWFVMTLAFVPSAKVALEDLVFDGGKEAGSSVAVIMEWLVLFTMFVLHFFPNMEREEGREGTHSEEEATFPSKLMFNWMNTLFFKGYKNKSLEIKEPYSM